MRSKQIKIGICVPTRNRPEALAECIQSIMYSIQSFHSNKYINSFNIYIRDNSDRYCNSIADMLNKYEFTNSLPVSYAINKKPLKMSDNWNTLAQEAIREDCDYLIFLADRRLLTPSIEQLMETIMMYSPEVVIFDHQSWWLSSSHLLQTRNYALNSAKLYSPIERIRDIKKVIFDGLTPRLYNCAVSSVTLKRFMHYYGSYVGGPFPDISFQTRYAFETGSVCIQTDIPVIACNARHASLTSSSSGIENKTSMDTFHCHKAKSLFGFADEFIFAQCISHIAEVVGLSSSETDDLNIWFSPQELFQKALWELSCPMTTQRFLRLQRNLEQIINNPNTCITRRMHKDNTKVIQKLIRSINNLPETFQRQPLDIDQLPLTRASFEKLENLPYNGNKLS